MSQQLPSAPQAGGSAVGGGANDNLDNPGVDPVNAGGDGPGGGSVGVVS